MAKLYVSEYAAGAIAGSQVGSEPSIAEQVVSYTGTSGASNAFNEATHLIRVHTDSICSIQIGTTPVATASMKRMAADQTEYFAVSPGSKIAAITNT